MTLACFMPSNLETYCPLLFELRLLQFNLITYFMVFKGVCTKIASCNSSRVLRNYLYVWYVLPMFKIRLT